MKNRRMSRSDNGYESIWIVCEKQLNAMWINFSAIHVDYSNVSESTCNKGTTTCILPVIILVIGMSCYSCYIITLRNKSLLALMIVELLAWIMLGMAWNFSGTLVRFLSTLLFLAAGVSIHSYTFPQIVDFIYKKNVEVKECSEMQSSFRLKFFKQLANTYYFNLFQRIDMFHYWRIPCIQNLRNIIVYLLMTDTCIYLIREFIPLSGHLRAENQTLAIAIVGGIWVLFCVEFAYSAISTQLDCCGVKLPLELSHKHPLVSASIGEFWGVRWNPIFGKLLQDSFYKPLRRLGISRASCVVTCFTGSAILHAWPQYVATRSSLDALGLVAFFVLQGGCLVLEVFIKRQLFPKQTISMPNGLPGAAGGELSPVGISDLQTASNSSTESASMLASHHLQYSNNSTSANISMTMKLSHHALTQHDKVSVRQKAALEYTQCCKRAPCQLSAELLLVACILSTAYWCLEFRPADRLPPTSEHIQLGNTVAAVAVTSGLGATWCYYNVRRYIYLNHTAASHHCALLHRSSTAVYPYSLFLCDIVGWVWTVLSILLLLPLFSLPILRSFQDFNSSSVFIGALVRSIQVYGTD